MMTNEAPPAEPALTRPAAAAPPTVGAALAAARQALAGGDAPGLTAEAALAHLLGLTRTQLLARPERPLSPAEDRAYAALLDRAARGEPLAYLTGQREFYGLSLAVDARVLVPRPETELVVDLALAHLRAAGPAPTNALDVGTGSGCIAIALAVHCPTTTVTALDLSAEALAVARANAERHGVASRVRLARSDLLAAVRADPARFEVLTANLPYVPTAEARALPVSAHEPWLALDGGPDGLAVVRRLLAEAPRHLAANGLLLLEIAADQGAAARALAQAAFPAGAVTLHRDLAGLDRVVAVHTR